MNYNHLLHISSFDNQIHDIIKTIQTRFQSILTHPKLKFVEYQSFIIHLFNIYSIIDLHSKTKCTSIDLSIFDDVFQQIFTNDTFKRITYAFDESCELHEYDIYFVKQIRQFFIKFNTKYIEAFTISSTNNIQINDVIKFLLLSYKIQDELKYDSFQEYIQKSIVIHNVTEIHSILNTFLKQYSDKLSNIHTTEFYQAFTEMKFDTQVIIQLFRFYCTILGLRIEKLSFNIFDVYDIETNYKKGTVYFDLFNPTYSDKCTAFNLWFHHQVDHIIVEPVVTILAHFKEKVTLYDLIELVHQFANAFHTLMIRPMYYHINNDHYLEIIHIVANIFEHIFFSKMVIEQILHLPYHNLIQSINNYHEAQLIEMHYNTSLCLLYIFLYETPTFKEDLREIMTDTHIENSFIQNISDIYNDILLYTTSQTSTKPVSIDLLKSMIQNNFTDYFIPILTYIISNNIIVCKLDDHVMNELDDLQTIGIEFRKLFLQQNFHNKNIKDILFFLNEDHPFLQSFQE
jgi:hypothetical protein